MVVVVVVVVLSRLCEDEALSRTQQARNAVVGVFVILCCVWRVTCTAGTYHTRYRAGSGGMCYLVRGSAQKSNNPSSERMEELLFLGSEITKSAGYWPRYSLDPEIPMLSGPIVDGFYFWRRRSLLKREIIQLSLKIFPIIGWAKFSAVGFR